MRVCKGCNVELELNEKNFYPRRTVPKHYTDHFSAYCRDCERSRSRERAKQRRSIITGQTKVYRVKRWQRHFLAIDLLVEVHALFNFINYHSDTVDDILPKLAKLQPKVKIYLTNELKRIQRAKACQAAWRAKQILKDNPVLGD